MTALSKALVASDAPAMMGMVMRGACNRMRLPTAGGGGANIARGSCVIIRCPYPFRYVQMMVPWYFLGATAAADVAVAADATVQAAIEYPLFDAMTGVPARTPFVTKSGASENFTFTAASPVFGTESVIIDMGQIVPAFAPFRLFTSFEWTSGSSPGSNTMPGGTFIGSSLFPNINERAFSQGTSLASASWAKTASNLGAASTTPTQGFVPLLRFGLTPGLASPLLLGSSTGDGTGEGHASSGIYGDVRGDIVGNRGVFERWFYSKLGIGWSNISVGSDQLNFRATLANILFRLEMAAWLNPTALILQGYYNDVSSGRTSAQIQADFKTVAGFYRNAIGRAVPYHIPTCSPASSGAWTLADLSDQTVTANRGPSSIAQQISDVIRSRSSDLGHRSCIELGDAWNSSRNSGKWKANGSVGWYTNDGTHSNSFGQYQAAEDLGTFNPFQEAA